MSRKRDWAQLAKRVACGIGRGVAGIARAVGVAASTMRGWIGCARGGVAPPRARTPRLGRPRRRVERAAVLLLVEMLTASRGRISVAELRRHTRIPRWRLERHRRLWRRRHARSMEYLQWLVAGSVWAGDWTELDMPIEPPGLGPPRRWALIVRDLASGMQLLALPAEHATASVVARALERLFRVHGPPLCFKSDNGSNMVAGEIPALLESWGVTPLRSPPETPRYNGAAEAGIGSMKARLDAIAHARGRPWNPTIDDLEEARLEANATARPHGRNGPTPDEIWAARQPISAEARAAWHAALESEMAAEAHRTVVAATNAATTAATSSIGREITLRYPANPATLNALDANTRATLARRATRRTLEALGYLTSRRLRLSST